MCEDPDSEPACRADKDGWNDQDLDELNDFDIQAHLVEDSDDDVDGQTTTAVKTLILSCRQPRIPRRAAGYSSIPQSSVQKQIGYVYHAVPSVFTTAYRERRDDSRILDGCLRA